MNSIRAFFIYLPAKGPRDVVSKLITNTDNATVQHDDSHHGDLVILLQFIDNYRYHICYANLAGCLCQNVVDFHIKYARYCYSDVKFCYLYLSVH